MVADNGLLDTIDGGDEAVDEGCLYKIGTDEGKCGGEYGKGDLIEGSEAPGDEFEERTKRLRVVVD